MHAMCACRPQPCACQRAGVAAMAGPAHATAYSPGEPHATAHSGLYSPGMCYSLLITASPVLQPTRRRQAPCYSLLPKPVPQLPPQARATAHSIDKPRATAYSPRPCNSLLTRPPQEDAQACLSLLLTLHECRHNAAVADITDDDVIQPWSGGGVMEQQYLRELPHITIRAAVLT